MKSLGLSLVTCAWLLVACGPHVPSTAERASVVYSCQGSLPQEVSGWEDLKFEEFSAASVSITESGAYQATTEMFGRSGAGQRQSASVTCEVGSPGEQKSPRISVGPAKGVPLTEDDTRWVHDAVLARAKAAESRGSYEDAIALLEGRGTPSLDSAHWYRCTKDRDFKALRALLKVDAAKAQAAEVRAKAAEVRAKAAESRAGATEVAVQNKAYNIKRAGKRRQMAQKLRNVYLDMGADIEVTVSGKDADRIELRYVLINAVWTRKFETSGVLDDLKAAGFERLDLNNGYDYHVVFTLRPP